MSKLIYEEVLDILVDSFQDPQDEDCDCYMLDRKQMNKIGKAIRQAQKQEKLLELYKQAYDKSNAEVLKMFTYEQDEKTTLTNIIGHLDDSETVVQIRELEK